MGKKSKILLGLLLIFVLGMITGASLMPVIFHNVEGNPYSMSVLAERVYNTNLLKNAGLTDDQKEAVQELSVKYVLKYTVERDMFLAKRRTLYSDFKYDLQSVLTPQQYSLFEGKSDKIITDREKYVKNLEKMWNKEREAGRAARLENSNKDSKQRLSYIQVTVPSENIMPNVTENTGNANTSIDLITRYMIDRVKYRWKTYTDYNEVEENITHEPVDNIVP